MNLKQIKFNKNSFIGGWIIPNQICDDIKKYFVKNIDKTGMGLTQQSKNNQQVVDPSIKESLDFSVPSLILEYPFNEYKMYLQQCLQEYIKIYPEVKQYSEFKIKENINIQFYPPKGGFKIFHFENGSSSSINRILVFMTYLNTVKNAGTEFKYQKIKTSCQKGLTLIWPSSFTHTHRGIVNLKKEKYIITGWYSLL